MREEAAELDVSVPDASLPERARERLARPAGMPTADTWRDLTRPAVRPATQAGSPEVVRVEVSQRQGTGPTARPVVVVQVELPEDPRGRGLALRPEPAPGALPVEERPRLALEPRSQPEEAGAARPGTPPERHDLSREARERVAVAAVQPAPSPRALARLPVTLGMACPRCGQPTYREPTPWFLRPLRWLLLGSGSWRRCPSYHWSGLALHR